MPVHIEEFTSEMVVIDTELPLTDAQLEKLVQRVLQRIEDQQRNAKRLAEAARVRESALPE